MGRLRVCKSAPHNLSYPYVDGSLRPGDEFDVADNKAAALLDTHDYLREADNPLSEADDEVVTDDGDDIPQDLEALTYDELYERATEVDIASRSGMDKAQLIDALSEE